MAKKPKIEKTAITIDSLLAEYAIICGSEAKAAVLKDQMTLNEIGLFLNEIKTAKEGLETDNQFDIGNLEDLAKLRIQENRLLKFQKDLLDEADQMKNADEPGLAEQSVKIRSDALKISAELREINFTKEKITRQLSSTRDQRLKVRNESKISMSAIIKQLDDHVTKERVGLHGELLKKATTKKRQSMINDGLIIVAKSQEKTIEQETIKEEDSIQAVEDTTGLPLDSL